MKIDLGLTLKVLANAAKDLPLVAAAAKALGNHEQAKGIDKLAAEMPELKLIVGKVASGSATDEETARLHDALHCIVEARSAKAEFANGLATFLPKPKEGMSALERARGARKATNVLLSSLLDKERLEEAKAVVTPLCQDAAGPMGELLNGLFSSGLFGVDFEVLSRRKPRERPQPASASV